MSHGKLKAWTEELGAENAMVRKEEALKPLVTNAFHVQLVRERFAHYWSAMSLRGSKRPTS